jgi:DNA-binding response OmpR family regulator
MLVCEGNVKISHSVEKALRYRGIDDIQVADSAASASLLLDRHDVSVAVVDFAAMGVEDATELVRLLSARGAGVILYSDRQPEPGEFADLHYVFVDKCVDIDALAHVAAAQRRLALIQPRS